MPRDLLIYKFQQKLGHLYFGQFSVICDYDKNTYIVDLSK
jgi:hypothetical protein